MLLSLAAPSLAALLPNPLPPSTPSSVATSKYPYTALRKSLRLLIDDVDPDEIENDISYVYSGYAPISIRLVQCIAQKGGVLSNPAEKEKKSTDDANGKKAVKGGSASVKVQAHPIVGWKGFEDVIASIPGETIDIVQKIPGSPDGGIPATASMSTFIYIYILILSIRSEAYDILSVLPKDQTTTTVVFFLGGCTYTEIAALRWVSRQNKGPSTKSL